MPGRPERKRATPLVRNLAVLGARLGRARAPDAPFAVRCLRRRAFGGAAALAAALIVLFLFTIDGHSPGWPAGMPGALRQGFEVVTRLGSSAWLLIPTGVFCVALALADWNRTSRRIAAAWIELGHFAGFFFVAISASGLTTNLVKWTIGRSRPLLFESDGRFALTPWSFDFAHVSFPSGHTTTAAAAATAIVLIVRGRPAIRIAVIGLALAIAVSRVMVGAHFPSDVVAGLFVGIAVTWACARMLGRRGVAFQSQPDGSLHPKAVALRRAWASAAGRRCTFRGLLDAWSRSRPPA